MKKRYATLSDIEKAALKRGFDDVLAGRITNIPLYVFTPEGFDTIQEGEEDIEEGRLWKFRTLDEVMKRLGDK